MRQLNLLLTLGALGSPATAAWLKSIHESSWSPPRQTDIHSIEAGDRAGVAQGWTLVPTDAPKLSGAMDPGFAFGKRDDEYSICGTYAGQEDNSLYCERPGATCTISDNKFGCFGDRYTFQFETDCQDYADSPASCPSLDVCCPSTSPFCVNWVGSTGEGDLDSYTIYHCDTTSGLKDFYLADHFYNGITTDEPETSTVEELTSSSARETFVAEDSTSSRAREASTTKDSTSSSANDASLSTDGDTTTSVIQAAAASSSSGNDGHGGDGTNIGAIAGGAAGGVAAVILIGFAVFFYRRRKKTVHPTNTVAASTTQPYVNNATAPAYGQQPGYGYQGQQNGAQYFTSPSPISPHYTTSSTPKEVEGSFGGYQQASAAQHHVQEMPTIHALGHEGNEAELH